MTGIPYLIRRIKNMGIRTSISRTLMASALSLVFASIIVLYYSNNLDQIQVSGQVTYEVHIQPGSSQPATPNPYNPTVLPSLANESVQVGSTVTWINDDQTFHTVTSGDALTGPDGKFDSGILSPLQSFPWTFNSAGTFSYYCTIHPYMRGWVRVG